MLSPPKNPLGKNPQLSICIPTHDGRAVTLEQTLQSIHAQLGDSPPGTIEVCISDGGSRDGTVAMVERIHFEFGTTLKYERATVDGGFAAHEMRSVDMASGRHCWLFSSDDAIAPGGIETVRRVLDADPDILGLSFPFVTYDRELIGPIVGTKAEAEDAKYFPRPWRHPRQFESRREVARELGVLFSYLASHVVRGDAWAYARATVELEGGLHSKPFPHIEIFSRMLDTGESWRWIPQQVVLRRGENDSWTPRVFDGNQARYWMEMLGELKRLYRDLSGQDAAVCRILMNRWRFNVAKPGHLLANRRVYGSTYTGWAEMVVGYTRSLWQSPQYWVSALPVLLIPPALLPFAVFIQHVKDQRLGR